MNSSQSSSGSSSQSSFSGIDNGNALAILTAYMQQLYSGGTADYKAQRANRNQLVGETKALQQDYSSEAAFHDAGALMEKQLIESYAKSMPAITKSIQGAGTSASSMQGLLSTNLATSAAREAAALGAQQKTQYGQISANLAQVLNNLTAIDTQNEQGMLKALDLFRVQKSQGSSSQQSSGSSSSPQQQGGGGGGGSSGGGGGFNANSVGGGYGGFGGSGGGMGNYVGDGSGSGDQAWGGSQGSGSSGSNDEPFYYDDWGTGSNNSGGMSGNSSAGDSGGGDYGYDTSADYSGYSGNDTGFDW